MSTAPVTPRAPLRASARDPRPARGLAALVLLLAACGTPSRVVRSPPPVPRLTPDAVAVVDLGAVVGDTTDALGRIEPWPEATARASGVLRSCLREWAVPRGLRADVAPPPPEATEALVALSRRALTTSYAAALRRDDRQLVETLGPAFAAWADEQDVDGLLVVRGRSRLPKPPEQTEPNDLFLYEDVSNLPEGDGEQLLVGMLLDPATGRVLWMNTLKERVDLGLPEPFPDLRRAFAVSPRLEFLLDDALPRGSVN